MPQDFGAEPAEEVRPQVGEKRRWSWVSEPQRLLGVTVGVAATGIVLGYLITVLFVFPSRSASIDLTRVPSVVGFMADEARELLAEEGLALEEEIGLHHWAAVGTIVAQEPLAGQLARPGSAIRVTTSLGPKLAPVPDVVGLGHAQAQTALARGGYESELVWIDSQADVGKVVDTRPAPGTPLQLPARVRLIVSAGPRRVEVPDLVTHSLDEARETLERLGLRLGTVREDSASLAAPGTVLRQSPRAGSTVDRAAKVAVTVAITPPAEPDTASSGQTSR